MPTSDTPAAPRIHRTPVQMRFADTDALGHVNNGSFILYAETARLEFLQALGSPVRSLILAHLSVDFRRQVMFGEPIVVDSWIARIGTTSVTMRHDVRAGDVVAAELTGVVVHFDYEAQQAQPWSDAVRAALADYLPGTGG